MGLSILDRAQRDPAVARRLSISLVFTCTLLGAAAQILMKAGTRGQSQDSALALAISIFRDPKLFLGYSLYGLSTALLVGALKYGQLSILYPVIALTYVWVTILSIVIHNETMNPWKVAGLCMVVLGVAVLGRTSRT